MVKDSITLLRAVSAEEYKKFLNNSLEPSFKRWTNDSEGVGYCYAVDESPEEVILNFPYDYLLILEVSPKLFANCKQYFGRNYKTIYQTGEIGTTSWKEVSKVVPFTAETCRSFTAIPRCNLEY